MELSITTSLISVTDGKILITLYPLDSSGNKKDFGTVRYFSVTKTKQTTPVTGFWFGDGSASNPYLISSPEDLALLAELVNAGNATYIDSNYDVTNDIDLSGYSNWVPIGNANYPFTGIFNGSGHTITGMMINAPQTDYQGLFGYIENAEIRYVGIRDVDVTEIIMSASYRYVKPWIQIF